MWQFLPMSLERSLRPDLRLGVIMVVLLVGFASANDHNDVHKECMGIKCKNDGTLVVKDNACACACAPGYSGVFCEYALTASGWPPGPYALPMGMNGCPEPESAGWLSGYMNFTAEIPSAILWRRSHQSANSTGETQTDIVDLRLPSSPGLLGPYNSFAFQLNFCHKTELNDTDDIGLWPEGAYSIYGIDTGCPSDFDSYNKTLLVLPSVASWNKDGHTPPINMMENNDGSVTLQALICQRKNTAAKNSSHLGDVPFLLLKTTGSHCATLDGYDVEEETLAVVPATEAVNQSLPEISDGLSYCYYKPSNWTKSYGSMTLLSFAGGDFTQYENSFKLRTASVTYPDEFRDVIQEATIDLVHSIYSVGRPFTNHTAYTFAAYDFIPWMLFDFGRVLNVKMVDVSVTIRARDTIPLHREFPEISVSNHKWAFLHHGTAFYTLIHFTDTRSPGSKDRHAHTFTGHAAGRYLSLYGKNYQSKEKMVEYFIHIYFVSIRILPDSETHAKSCLQKMGMEDGGIRDYQLSASSWQPGYPPHGAVPLAEGWCATVDDPNPFLQVDLLSPTLVEGFTVFNWLVTEYLTFMGSEFPFQQPKGTNAVRLHYSTSGTHFRAYQQQLFQKDRSAPFLEPQTFVLERPVLARYIRIEVTPTGNSSCLKLELLGCRKHGLHSVQCTNDETRTMFKANVALKSIPFPAASPDVTSHEECMTSCHDDVLGCMTVMYKENAFCDIYTPDPRRQYHLVKASKGTTQTTFVCWKDAYEMGPQVGDDFDFHALYYTTPTQVGPGIVTTPNYPIPYATGQDYFWAITVDGGKFARLLFSNVSLHTYGNMSGSGCSDVLDVIQIYLGRRKFLMSFSHTSNGHYPFLGSGGPELFIRLKACNTFLQNHFQGSGFRALVLAEDLPFCHQVGSRASCILESMMIGSRAFLGLPDTIARERWRLGGRGYKGVVVTFLDFNVECDAGSVFRIETSRQDRDVYCNANLTFRVYNSPYGLLDLSFERAPYNPALPLEGFKAKYVIAKDDTTLLDTVTSITVNTEKKYELPDYHKVCVDRFKKCYYILKITSTPRDAWSTCQKLNTRRVSLRDRLEGQVIRAVITNLTGIIYYTMRYGFHGKTDNPYMFVHIGMNTYYDAKGVLHEYWDDGSPVLYFDWLLGQPSDVRKNRCVGMRAYAKPLSNTWETISCDNLHSFTIDATKNFFFHFVVCEESTDSNRSTAVTPNFDENAGRLLSSRTEPAGEPKEAGALYRCLSGEWIIRLSVCNGFPDCLDGSDERNCTETDTGCAPDQFQCSNDACIHLSQTCDFQMDCKDGEDEYCEYPSCSSDEFQCQSKQCVKADQRCDSMKDCYDGSDEIGCTQCDSSTSIMCSDFTCINKNRKCDGYRDCPGGQDEVDCGLSSISDCTGAWETGLRGTQSYTIQSDRSSAYYSWAVWCGFDDVYSENRVTLVLNKTDIFDQKLRYDKFLYDPALFLPRGYVCKQKVTQTCLAPEKEVAQRDGIHFQISHSDCACVQLEITLHTDSSRIYSNRTAQSELLGYYEINFCGDPGNPQASVSDVSNFGNASNENFIHGYPIHTVPDRFRNIPDVFECEKTGYIPPDDFACENALRVFPNAQLCLYSEDPFGLVDACRDKVQLRGCETFQCPTGYVKCPNSFCINTQFVCDGRIHCPNGEDELGCYCKDRNQTVMLFHHTLIDATTQETIHGLARQFYTPSRTISVFEYEFLSDLRDSSLIAVLSNQINRVQMRMTEHVVTLSNENMNAFQSRTFLTYFDTLMHVLVDQTNASETDYAFISIGNTPISETFGTTLFHDDTLQTPTVKERYYYTISLDVTIRGTTERSTDGMVTQVKLRNLEYLTLGSVLLPEICNVTDDILCPNEYRCAASRACISLNQVCDEIPQCTHEDDEKLCNFQCPKMCSCNGYIINCGDSNFVTSDFSHLYRQTRTLDLSFNTNVSSDGIVMIPVNLPFLSKLNLSHCEMTTVNPDSFSNTTNLRELDIGYNRIEIIPVRTFQLLRFLKHLNLKGNVVLKTLEPGAFLGLSSISELTISGTRLSRIVPNTFLGLTLTSLDLSSNKIDTVDDFAFQDIIIESINLEGNDIDVFSDNMFVGVKAMTKLRSSEYKFCCIRPGDVLEEDCLPYKNEFSSCADLMRNSALQALLWIVGLTAFLGNIGSLVYRLTLDRKRLKLGYGIFVTNLAVADFMMSVFMIIIAIADVVFRDRYIWNDESWRNSGWCTLAGFLSTVSSEASVFFILLITIDRLLVIKYPFGDVRFSPNTAWITCFACWISAFIIAFIPIIYSDYFDGRFYAKSGVCLALPLTRDRPPGWLYSILIFIAFNFLTFLMIAAGQVMLFLEIKKAPAVGSNKGQNNRVRDLKIARNLLLVVTTDFMCWFPIGIMGLIAASGTPISGSVYAWAAVLILPINSALNPFLYTASAILSKRKFAPDLNEQSRTKENLEAARQFVQIWEFNGFVRENDYIERHRTLDEIVQLQTLSPKCAAWLVLNIVARMDFLHKQELLFGKLQMDKILVITEQGKKMRILEDMQIRLKPVVCTDKNGKPSDVYELGGIVRNILRATMASKSL